MSDPQAVAFSLDQHPDDDIGGDIVGIGGRREPRQDQETDQKQGQEEPRAPGLWGTRHACFTARKNLPVHLDGVVIILARLEPASRAGTARRGARLVNCQEDPK